MSDGRKHYSTMHDITVTRRLDMLGQLNCQDGQPQTGSLATTHVS